VTVPKDQVRQYELEVIDRKGCLPWRVLNQDDRSRHKVRIDLECEVNCSQINPVTGQCCDQLCNTTNETYDELKCKCCIDPDLEECKEEECKNLTGLARVCCLDPYSPKCDPCQDPKDCPPYSPDDVYVLGGEVVNLTGEGVPGAVVGIVNKGFPEEMMTLVNQTGHEARYIDLATIPVNDLYDLKALIVPSGGLYDVSDPLGASEIISLKIRLFLEHGGNLIVFTQQYGYEWSAIPGGLTGYGYQEDQNCLLGSVYIENYRPVFSSISETKTPNADGAVFLNLNVDGFFLDYPANATVLLTRDANKMPAMLAYPWANGHILATTMYPDFAYVFGSGTDDEIILLKDMIDYMTLPDPENVETYIPEEEKIEVQVDSQGMEREYLLVICPKGLVIDTIRAENGVFPDLDRSELPDINGIYRIDYIGADNGFHNITVMTDVDAFAISDFNETLRKQIPKGVDFWVLFDKNYYYVTGSYGSDTDAGGEPGFVTFFIHNHQDTWFNGSVKFGVWGMFHILGWGYGTRGCWHEVNVNVPPHEYREYTERFATSQWDAKTYSYLYDGPSWTGKQIAFMERRYGVLKGQSSLI
ncbi:MAG: hypothetical protein KAU14_06370, partial [Thermoplasmata archaeon]|nr:hypothetical protein [Thermoplasmata archaeon]